MKMAPLQGVPPGLPDGLARFLGGVKERLEMIFGERGDAAVTHVVNTLGLGSTAAPSLVCQELVDAPNIEWNVANGAAARVRIAGNRTMLFPINVPAGGWGWLDIIQAAGTETITFATGYKHPLGVAPALINAANGRSRFFWSSWDGSEIDLTHAKDMR